MIDGAIGSILGRLGAHDQAIERLQRIETPARYQLGRSVLGSSAAGITVSGIPGGRLLLYAVARVRNAGAGSAVGLQINNDGVTKLYRRNAFAQAALTWAVQEDVVSAIAWVGATTASTDEANSFGTIELWFPDYATTSYHKTGLYRWGVSYAGTANSFSFGMGVLHWPTTSVITRLDLSNLTGGANFAALSSLTVFGF
jgi:hypothetical protein